MVNNHISRDFSDSALLFGIQWIDEAEEASSNEVTMISEVKLK